MRNRKPADHWKFQIASLGNNWIKKQQQDPIKPFNRFTRGSMLFAVGMIFILFADRLLVSSIQQELIALLGLLIVFTGGIISLSGFLAITFGRILVYLLPDTSSQHNNSKPSKDEINDPNPPT